MKNSQSRRRIILILGTLLVALVVAAVIAIVVISEAAGSVGQWLSFDSGCLGTKPYSTEKIEEITGISIPPDVTELQAEASGIQDCEIFLSFSIKPDDLSDFVSSTYVKMPLIKGKPSGYFDNPPSTLNWSLDNQKTYLVAEGEKNGNRQYIAVDTSNPRLYIVYFSLFLQ